LGEKKNAREEEEEKEKAERLIFPTPISTMKRCIVMNFIGCCQRIIIMKFMFSLQKNL